MRFGEVFIRKGWAIIFPAIILITLLWLYPETYLRPLVIVDEMGFATANTQTLYLLSAIAQSLAAVLALVFTLSFIAFQLQSNYSQKFNEIYFNAFTVLYIFLFVVSILMALLTIEIANTVAINISISMAVICFLLLLPYFLNLRCFSLE